jgi:cathepsin L
MRATLLVLAAFLAVAFAIRGAAVPGNVLAEIPVRIAWESFKAKYSKQYVSTQEEQQRFNIFKTNFAFINTHNQRTDVTFKVDINAFADLSNAEFVEMMNGYRAPANKVRKATPFKLGARTCPPGQTGSSDYNSTCDWRVANVVTPVKNQGQCGSCWSFSTTGSTEGAHALATGNLVSLSEQNLIDCSDAEGDMGCNGGLMDDAFTYIIKNKGIDTEASYPYQAVDGTCHFKNTSVGATLSSYQDIPTGNEDDLAAAIQTVGPVSVAIDAAGMSFQFYKSGIYYDLFCSSKNLDHGVLAVGLGTGHTILGTHDYYIVKNSWGADWGMAGYLYMSRNRNNNCGIATAASYPIV